MMSVADYTRFSKQLRRIAKEWRNNLSERELSEIENVYCEAEDKAAKLADAGTLEEIRTMDRVLRRAAVAHLVGTIDTTVETDMDLDDPEFFCVDGYIEMLDDPKIFSAVVRSDCNTAEDIVSWLDQHYRWLDDRPVRTNVANIALAR